jgi:hypothetical protein
MNRRMIAPLIRRFREFSQSLPCRACGTLQRRIWLHDRGALRQFCVYGFPVVTRSVSALTIHHQLFLEITNSRCKCAIRSVLLSRAFAIYLDGYSDRSRKREFPELYSGELLPLCGKKPRTLPTRVAPSASNQNSKRRECRLRVDGCPSEPQLG